LIFLIFANDSSDRAGGDNKHLGVLVKKFSWILTSEGNICTKADSEAGNPGATAKSRMSTS
jgi:hypothetical protein